MDQETFNALTNRFDAVFLAVVRVMFNSLFYALYVPLFIWSTRILRRRTPKSRPSRIMLIATSFQFFWSTFGYIADMVSYLLQIKSWYPHTLSETVAAQLGPQSQVSLDVAVSSIIAGIADNVLIFAGDAIITWRACSLFPESRWLRYSLLVFLTCSGAVSLANIVSLGMTDDPDHWASPTQSLLTNNLWTATIAVSLAVNFVATTAIGYKAWSHRATLPARQKSAVLPILSLLLECGFAFMCAQIIDTVLALVSRRANPISPINSANGIWDRFLMQIAAAYPSLLVIIVARRPSVVDGTTLMFEQHGNVRPVTRVDPARQGPLTTLKFASTGKNDTMTEGTQSGSQGVDMRRQNSDRGGERIPEP